MATGTEGPDILSNDQSLSEEAIDALGGDDIINVTNRPSGASWITVDGGSGVDTLTITAPYLRALGPTFAIMSNGFNTADNQLDYSSVERLVVHAGVFFGFDRFGHRSGIWRTGDTTDEIHVTGTFDRTAQVAVVTGGGDDKIYFGAVARGSSAFGGTGDDLVDLSGVQGDSIDPLNPVSAYGEDGNDRLIGSSHTDRLDGGVGNDELFSGDGFDTLYGGAGDDLVYFGAWFTGSDRAHGARRGAMCSCSRAIMT